MSTLTYGATTINYILYTQSRNDLKISITLVNGVEVYAPIFLDVLKINELLIKKAPWILNKIKDLNQAEITNQHKEFVCGEKLTYLGRNYRLKVHRVPIDQTEIKFFQGRFIATVPREWPQSKVQETLEKQLIQWYRVQGEKRLKQRAVFYQDLLNVEAASIQLRAQHKRWGTCTPGGHIYINWRLVMAPMKVLDYVIVHELVHLIVRDHSQEFWNTVKSILPDYENRKEWLRVHGMGLHYIG